MPFESLKLLAKRLMPGSARNAIRSTRERRRLNRALKPLASHGFFTDQEIAEFRSAWGNEGFSADRAYIAEVMRILIEQPGHVLECGTGATTMLSGILAERNGFSVYSMEQDPEWTTKIKGILNDHGIRRVRILDGPLARTDDYAWYDVPQVAIPMHFSVVICDGPYIAKEWGSEIYENWRYGILPWMKRTGRTFDVLILDDVDEPRSVPVIERWRREFGVSVQIINSGNGMHALIMQPKSPSPLSQINA